MATEDRNAAFSAFVSAGASRAGREQEKLFAELLRQGQAQGLEQGAPLLELFRLLPAAALASERAEYDRVVSRYGKDHPLAHAREQSLDAMERGEAQAARGRARAARALHAAQAPGEAFHGFVSDEAGEPLPGLTVRLASARTAAKLEARTEADGYFRVPLPQRAAEPAAAEKAAEEVAEVLIVDSRGQTVHQDPVGLALRAGSAYREYTVAAGRGAAEPRQRAPRAAPAARRKKHP
jgi:hypothetical protein